MNRSVPWSPRSSKILPDRRLPCPGKPSPPWRVSPAWESRDASSAYQNRDCLPGSSEVLRSHSSDGSHSHGRPPLRKGLLHRLWKLILPCVLTHFLQRLFDQTVLSGGVYGRTHKLTCHDRCHGYDLLFDLVGHFLFFQSGFFLCSRQDSACFFLRLCDDALLVLESLKMSSASLSMSFSFASYCSFSSAAFS